MGVISQKEPSPIASNQYMALTSEWFLKRKGIMESKFLISVNYSFNIIKIVAMRT